MSTIRFEDVNKSYEGQTVLREFSTVIPSGDMKIVLGGTGSGKSTILKMVLGLVQPDSGRIFVGDQDITQLNEEELMPLRGRIGMVFQEGALFDFLTVGGNVGYRLREQNSQPEKEIRATVTQVLGFVGLEGSIDKMPSELSGGMKRRVAIARAIVGSPQIMLYDEPTAGLDPITSRTICELVIRLRDLEKITSLFVTHDLKAAMTLAAERAVVDARGKVSFQPKDANTPQNTRFIMIESGRILLEGTDRDLGTTRNDYIREFLD